ncbi:MAG: sel1 repeat family protein [Clostridia bacterium]|nr:sel1 repeat family protein [Clostridia bacterium]
MSQRKFIRMNINDNYLSVGNVFRIIKEETNTTNMFLQADLFSIIFNTYNIADSTVNNYCTGLRAINPKYRNYFKEMKNKFEQDKNVFIFTIGKILELIEIEEIDVDNITIEQINNSLKLKHICNRLYTISKNDSDVSIKLSNELYKNLEECNLYNFMIQILFYVILDKKQPIYINEQLNEIIEKNIYDTNISVNDIQDFIKVQLNSGIWSIRGINELAKKNNPFACFEIASMEFHGIATGKSRYEEAYKYYKIAAEHNHPVANWAIGYLYYEGYIGNKSKRDLYLAFKYFNKSRKLKCSNAFNSLGLIILNGSIPHIKRNKRKAIEMFEKAISLGNIYAYNNLGKIYENKKDYKKAYDYYLSSAELGESWAANKIGEFYRKGISTEKNLRKALHYYTISSESLRFTLCLWSKYNLAKYFYKDGNLEIDVKQNINKAIELLEDIADELIEASKELLYIYYELYIKSGKEDNHYKEKVYLYKEKCEKNINYNDKIKQDIENRLKQINIIANPIDIL